MRKNSPLPAEPTARNLTPAPGNQRVRGEPGPVDFGNEIDAEAPLGLGFEMPEEVWVLVMPNGRILSFLPEELMHAWASEAEAVVAIQMRADRRIYATGDFGPCTIGACIPYRVELESLRIMSLAVVPPLPGIALRDAAWREIARRYWS